MAEAILFPKAESQAYIFASAPGGCWGGRTVNMKGNTVGL